MGVRAYTWRTEDGVTSEPVEIAPEPSSKQDQITKDLIKALDAMIAAYEADWTDWSRKDAREHWEAIVAFSRDALAKAQE